MVHISLAHTVHSFFRKYYNLVKGFLHENTHSKIFFLGSEFTSETPCRGMFIDFITLIKMSLDDYKEVLLKYISPDQLPKAYGGTRCEPNPYCTEHVSHAIFNVDGRSYCYIHLWWISESFS